MTNNVNDQLITDLSHLAKLKFNKKSAAKMQQDLESILDFIETLSEVDTEGVDPLIYMSKEVNILRNDEIINELSQKDTLKNAPQKDSDYFQVPTVLKK